MYVDLLRLIGGEVQEGSSSITVNATTLGNNYDDLCTYIPEIKIHKQSLLLS